MRKIYCDYHYVDDLVRRYSESGGHAIQLREGVLASGEWVLYDDTDKLKCFHIDEEAVTGWSSRQVIKAYNGWSKFPKKYKAIIECDAVYRKA